jgi:hypothetical protein
MIWELSCLGLRHFVGKVSPFKFAWVVVTFFAFSCQERIFSQGMRVIFSAIYVRSAVYAVAKCQDDRYIFRNALVSTLHQVVIGSVHRHLNVHFKELLRVFNQQLRDSYNFQRVALSLSGSASVTAHCEESPG